MTDHAIHKSLPSKKAAVLAIKDEITGRPFLKPRIWEVDGPSPSGDSWCD